MRIISGKFKGHKLNIPKNFLIRPTTDRFKESLFSIINSEKYSSNIYKFNPPEIVSPKSKTKITEQMFTVKDYIGEDVEINPVLFLQHINKYHANGISIHKQDGRSFKIDNDLRERLKLITFWQ